MTRRSITHVLLSLLLLLSQQAAIAHVMSHWSAQINAPVKLQAGKDDGGLAKAIVQDQRCDQCLAFAQLASALGNSTRSFLPPEASTAAIGGTAGAPFAACAACPFDSRAPPAID